MKTFISIFILILILNSCEKQDFHSNTSSSYPDEIGNSWTYSYYNPKIKTFEILTVTVTKDTILNNGKHVRSLQNEYSNSIDKDFIYISGDTVVLFESPYINSSLFAYIFPLEKGKTWANFNSYMVWDSTIVIDKIMIEVFPKEFYEGYEIIRKGWQFEGGYIYKVWFVPGIGEIKWFDLKVPSISDNHIARELININFKP